MLDISLSLSLSLSLSSELYTQSKQLATQLQCVLVCTRPCELPGRLVNQDIVNNTLQSLFDAVSLTSRFLTIGPKLDEDGLKYVLLLSNNFI